MLSKRILVLVFVVAFLTLMVGCGLTTPPIENLPPEITTDPVTTATVGMKYTYDVDAIDPNGDALTYSLTTKPGGMVINFTTGVITWIPSYGQLEYNTVVVEASDGVKSATQTFTIFVTKRTPMKITVDLPTFTVGEPYWFTVTMVANSDLGKLVVASFGVPKSAANVEIAGTLQTDIGSDLDFLLTGDTFQTKVFTMVNAEANFRGTFTSPGTYSTTIKVWTYPGDVLLCSKVIDITVLVEGKITIRWLEDAESFYPDDNSTWGSWQNDPIPPDDREPATLIQDGGGWYFADAYEYYNFLITPEAELEGSIVISATGLLTGYATYLYNGLPTEDILVGQVEITIYDDEVSRDHDGTMVGTYTQETYKFGTAEEVIARYPRATLCDGSEIKWFVRRAEYTAHGEELTP